MDDDSNSGMASPDEFYESTGINTQLNFGQLIMIQINRVTFFRSNNLTQFMASVQAMDDVLAYYSEKDTFYLADIDRAKEEFKKNAKTITSPDYDKNAHAIETENSALRFYDAKFSALMKLIGRKNLSPGFIIRREETMPIQRNPYYKENQAEIDFKKKQDSINKKEPE